MGDPALPTRHLLLVRPFRHGLDVPVTRLGEADERVRNAHLRLDVGTGRATDSDPRNVSACFDPVVLHLVLLAIERRNKPDSLASLLLGPEDQATLPPNACRMDQLRIPIGHPQLLAERGEQLECDPVPLIR